MALNEVFEVAKGSYIKKLFLNAGEHFSSVIFHSIDDDIVTKSLFYRATCYSALGLIKKSLQDADEFLQSSTELSKDKEWGGFLSLEGILVDIQRHLNTYVQQGYVQTIEFKKLVDVIRKIQIRFKHGLIKSTKVSLSSLSYTQQLLEDYRDAKDPSTVLSSVLNGVTISSNTDLKISLFHKVTSHKWAITVHCSPCRALHRVALLHNTHLSHFHIDAIFNGEKKISINEKCHDWEGLLEPLPNMASNSYTVSLCFNSEMYGSFHQTLTFNFGSRPVLCIPISVSTKLDSVLTPEESLITLANSWDNNNCKIVKLTSQIKPVSEHDKDEELIGQYRMPPLNTRVLDHILTEHNYAERMHTLLYIEENAQFLLLHSQCSRCTLKLVDSFALPGSNVNTGTKYARPGELFAKLTLPVSLSVDKVIGSIISKSVTTVLIRPVKSTSDNENQKPIVYEAVIEEKTLNDIFIRMTSQTIQTLALSTDDEREVSVQFQLNRIPFCRMHYVVDLQPNICMLFPPVLSHYIQMKPLEPVLEAALHPLLNENQLKAVRAAVCSVSVAGTDLWFPPVLLSGPFGTGKTFTLAQITLTLLKRKNTKVLICTHSNSAADLYIKDFFHHEYKNGNKDAKPLRVLYEQRWRKAVSEDVYEYTLPDSSNKTMFKRPSVQDIMNHRVVITTLSTAKYLTDINLDKGVFTHILLDEAAQALECEVISPLLLMNAMTRVILAGDHRQLSPIVRSRLANECDFDVSLLQRLFNNYPEKSPFRILLTKNYRSHPDIVDFASKWFYENQLEAKGVNPVHPKFKPITFFAARGEESQPAQSTSFYNVAEAVELCERIKQLQSSWPATWGSLRRDPNCIGVVTPYVDQVMVIRSELKRQKVRGVAVESVNNVQGKQYRALFLSTVRSRSVYDTIVIGGTGKKSRDYGFLSDANLLNTAITRARSLLAVVGDPMTLCSTGNCRDIWASFIANCNQSKSLYGITMVGIEEVVLGTLTKNTLRLNPHADDFFPNLPNDFQSTTIHANGYTKTPPPGFASRVPPDFTAVIEKYSKIENKTSPKISSPVKILSPATFTSQSKTTNVPKNAVSAAVNPTTAKPYTTNSKKRIPIQQPITSLPNNFPSRRQDHMFPPGLIDPYSVPVIPNGWLYAPRLYGAPPMMVPVPTGAIHPVPYLVPVPVHIRQPAPQPSQQKKKPPTRPASSSSTSSQTESSSSPDVAMEPKVDEIDMLSTDLDKISTLESSPTKSRMMQLFANK